MAIYEITRDALVSIPTTTFADKGIRERQDLQHLLRKYIDAIAPDTYVLAEEYGNWEDAGRDGHASPNVSNFAFYAEGDLVIIVSTRHRARLLHRRKQGRVGLQN